MGKTAFITGINKIMVNKYWKTITDFISPDYLFTRTIGI